MSRDYYAKNKKARGFHGEEGSFGVNVSGAQLLDHICSEAGWFSESIWGSHVSRGSPMVASAARCKQGAKKIRALDDAMRKSLWAETGGSKSPRLGRFHDMTFEDFCRFLDAWAKFLETCKGYDTG